MRTIDTYARVHEFLYFKPHFAPTVCLQLTSSYFSVERECRWREKYVKSSIAIKRSSPKGWKYLWDGYPNSRYSTGFTVHYPSNSLWMSGKWCLAIFEILAFIFSVYDYLAAAPSTILHYVEIQSLPRFRCTRCDPVNRTLLFTVYHLARSIYQRIRFMSSKDGCRQKKIANWVFSLAPHRAVGLFRSVWLQLRSNDVSLDECATFRLRLRDISAKNAAPRCLPPSSNNPNLENDTGKKKRFRKRARFRSLREPIFRPIDRL